MPSLRNVARPFALLAVAALVVAALPRAQAEVKVEIANWKEILPEADFVKLVEDSAKTMQDFAKSASSFNLNAKKLTNEAYSLVVYAEIARNGLDGDMAKKATLLQNLAIDLAAAAKDKNLEKCKELVKQIADFKKMKPDDTKPTSPGLAKAVPLHNLMEQVQALFKKFDTGTTAHKRLNAAQFGAKGKTEEIALDSLKLGALSVAAHAHAPTADLPKGKTTQDWIKSTDDWRKANLEIAAAARGKKLADVQAGIKRMNAACTKCHDDFRVEAN